MAFHHVMSIQPFVTDTRLDMYDMMMMCDDLYTPQSGMNGYSIMSKNAHHGV